MVKSGLKCISNQRPELFSNTRRAISDSKTLEKDIVTNVDDPKVYVGILGGLPRFATREHDLQRIYGDLGPVVADALLDKQLLPTGRWRIETSSYELLYAIKDRVAAMTAQYCDLNLTVSAGRLQTWNNRDQYVLASKAGVTSSTVRFKDVPNSCKEHHLVYLLENYNMIAENPIVKFHDSKVIGKLNYLVHFISPNEARRCVIDKLHSPVEGFRLNMFKYEI